VLDIAVRRPSMNRGVPQIDESLTTDSLVVSRRPEHRAARTISRAGLSLFCVFASLLFASNAFAAVAAVGLGASASFSVLAGSTITNTGPTTMSSDLGLSPGSSVTGAPVVFGQTHVDDAVAIEAKTALTTAFNEAASRPSNGSAGTDLAGQTFLAGVHSASSSLLLSSGAVTLNAQGDPDAVFIFQVGSTLITGSGTRVLLTNGARACNVFWEVGSSATLGTATQFVGTIMAAKSITARSAATIEGRLLAQTGAVTLEANTITTSACASSEGVETETTTTPIATTGTGLAPGAPIASKTTIKHRGRHHHHGRKASKPRSPARPALPHKRGAFTG
jgi:hypothetical protein